MSETTVKQVNYSLDGQGVNYIRNFLLDVGDTPDSNNALQLKLDSNDNRLKYHDGNELKEVALLSDVGSGGTGGSISFTPVDATLATVDADTWTDFPTQTGALWFGYQILNSAGQDIKDQVLIRDNTGTYQIRSSVALSNLTFRYVTTN